MRSSERCSTLCGLVGCQRIDPTTEPGVLFSNPSQQAAAGASSSLRTLWPVLLRVLQIVQLHACTSERQTPRTLQATRGAFLEFLEYQNDTVSSMQAVDPGLNDFLCSEKV